MQVKNYTPNPQLACAVIDELGGVTAVAEEMKLAAGSVGGWKTYGLPQSRYQLLKLKFPDLKAWAKFES